MMERLSVPITLFDIHSHMVQKHGVNADSIEICPGVKEDWIMLHKELHRYGASVIGDRLFVCTDEHATHDHQEDSDG